MSGLAFSFMFFRSCRACRTWIQTNTANVPLKTISAASNKFTCACRPTACSSGNRPLKEALLDSNSFMGLFATGLGGRGVGFEFDAEGFRSEERRVGKE